MLVFSLLPQCLYTDTPVALGSWLLAPKMMRLTQQNFPYCCIPSDPCLLDSTSKVSRGKEKKVPSIENVLCARGFCIAFRERLAAGLRILYKEKSRLASHKSHCGMETSLDEIHVERDEKVGRGEGKWR